jgi:integrase
VKRSSTTEPATLPELATLVAAMPQRYRLMTLFAAWCGLRYGELIELRVRDIDQRARVLRVRRACSWAGGAAVVSTPKTSAGIRDVAIPPHLVPAVREHLAAMIFTGKDALLFPSATDPSAHMRPATLTRVFYPARKKAGRPDLRFHDLRHTSAVLAASTGATLAELMARLGHTTPAAAMRYQHAAQGRDAQIAAKLSEIAGGSAAHDH